MLLEEIYQLSIEEILTLFRPLLLPQKPRPCMDIGFDSEFDSKGIISFQLSYKDKHCIIKTNVINEDVIMNKILDFIELNTDIHLISHFAQAELGNLESFKGVEVQPINRSLFWRTKDFSVYDLFSYFPTSLDKIGLSIGIPKKVIDYSRLRELADNNDPSFYDYAITDAIICEKAWNTLKDTYITRGIDIHRYRTLASIAIADYRLNYMEKVEPSQLLWRESRHQFTTIKSSEYSSQFESRPLFGEDKLDTRLWALKAYWGGRNEAYVRGIFESQPIYSMDVISLYIASALLQNLPQEDINWFKVSKSSSLQGLDGFVEIKYKFPDDCLYPSLLEATPFSNKRYFVRNGQTITTINEALNAHYNFGANIEIIDGVGFEVSDCEETSLHKYLKAMFERKRRANKDSLEYLVEKIKMVSVIGKFVEISPEIDLQMMYKLRQQGMDEIGRIITDRKVGTAWYPEWASLILGKARSIMSIIIANMKPLIISTDGGLFFNSEIPQSIDSALKSVGSGVLMEGEGNRACVIRTRLYACFKDDELVKEAHHAMHVKPDDWVNLARDIIKGSKLPKYINSYRLTTIKDYILRADRVNIYKQQIFRMPYEWDFKRHIDDPFVSWDIRSQQSVPYQSVLEALKNEYLYYEKLGEIAGLKRFKVKEKRGLLPNLSSQAKNIKMRLQRDESKKLRELNKRLSVEPRTLDTFLMELPKI